MKNKGLIVFLICLLTIVLVLVTIFFIKLLNGNFNISIFKSVSDTIIEEKEFENIYDEVILSSKNSDIEIKKTDSDNIKIVIYGSKKDKIEYNQTNKLDINFIQETCKFFCINNKRGKVLVYIPSNYDKNIIIKTDVGDVSVDDLIGLNVDITTNVGDVNIKNINEAIINTDVGEINISKVNSRVDITTNVGDVRIDDLNITKNSKIYTDIGDITIRNINDVNIEYKNDIGNKNVNKNNKDSMINLMLETDIGDIDVE